MKRLDATYFSGKNLPKFLDVPGLSGVLFSRGIAWMPDHITELVESGQIPCFFVDQDRTKPLFLAQDVIEWIRAERLYHQAGAAMTVLATPIGLPAAPLSVPPELRSVEGLLESPATEAPCVYFLLAGGRVVYVGQSTQLAVRITRHRDDGKQFDRVLFLNVPRSQLNAIEARFIEELSPELNIAAGYAAPNKRRAIA